MILDRAATLLHTYYMNCDEYLEILWNDGSLGTVISEQYWGDGVDTEDLFEYMLRCASKDGVLLTDMNVWDYDKALYACYRDDLDKGLS